MMTIAPARLAALLALLAPLVAASANAQTAIEEALDAPRVMLYASKRFGAARDERAAPVFGLRYEQAVRGARAQWQMDPSDLRFVPMLDLRLRKGYGTLVSLYNMPVYGLEAYYGANYEESSAAESWNNPWLWVGIGAGALAVSCASDNWPCDDDDDDPYVPPGE